MTNVTQFRVSAKETAKKVEKLKVARKLLQRAVRYLEKAEYHGLASRVEWCQADVAERLDALEE